MWAIQKMKGEKNVYILTETFIITFYDMNLCFYRVRQLYNKYKWKSNHLCCKNKKGGIYALQNHIEERQTTQWSKEKGQQ
jgi:hypothetical protein